MPHFAGMLVVLEIALFSLALLGVVLTLVGVPGNWFPVVIASGYWYFEGAPRFSTMILLWFLGIMASGEIIEQLAATMGAKKYGSSKTGMVGAFVGSIIGAIVGSLLLPVVGTVVFVFVGCFVLTLAFEVYFAKKDLAASARAGWGAVLGKALGVAYKYAAGFALLGLLAWRFWFI